MSTYTIGFIVCLYATVTQECKDRNVSHPDEKTYKWSWELMMLLGCLAISMLWPIALAVWMRDIKKP